MRVCVHMLGSETGREATVTLRATVLLHMYSRPTDRYRDAALETASHGLQQDCDCNCDRDPAAQLRLVLKAAASA